MPGDLIHVVIGEIVPADARLFEGDPVEDAAGQDMIRQWIEFVSRPEVRPRVVFLTDYDLLMAEHLVQGVDVLVNTPRRPWEASGTNGMKVLVNGGLNLSELGGWWAEAYSPDFGWAIGDGKERGDDPSWDAAEADALYALLEREIVPEFYRRDASGIPVQWAARIRESLARLTPVFSTNRTVRQYTEEHYLPAASAYSARAARNGQIGVDLLEWQASLRAHWVSLRFSAATVDRQQGDFLFHMQVFLDRVDPDCVAVELFGDGKNGGSPERHPMDRGERLVGAANGFAYSARVPALRSATDFTLRLIPFHQHAIVPLELPLVLWHDSPGWR